MEISEYKYMDSIFLDSHRALDDRNVISERELTVVEEENAVILPFRREGKKGLAGVVSEAGEYIEISGFKALSEVDSWGGAYLADNPEYRDEEVIYFGRFWKHWGHFLMGMVSRLWYISEDKSNARIAYDSTVEIEGVYLEFMELLGIAKDRLLRIDKPVRFKRVIIPECSHCPGISVNRRYLDIFDRVAKAAVAKLASPEAYKGKRIYFTRTMQKNLIPMEVGEKEIEKIFEKNGFIVVAPEQYSLTEQAAMVNLADTVACVAGTLPHNMVFAHKGEKLFIIRKTYKPNYRQIDVNQMRELEVVNVDAHISPKPVVAGGPFVLVFNDNLKRFFDDFGFEYKFSSVSQWFKRKAKLLWFFLIYIKRNKGSKSRVPIFDGDGFVNKPGAEKELHRFYMKRI